jgi:hypothetical protein
MVRRVLATAATVFPDTVVNVAHSWSGNEQSFSAIRAEITVDPTWEIDGHRVAKAYMLTIDRSAIDSRDPEAGDIVRVAKGDEEAEELVVKSTRKDGLDATLRLFCAKEWSA